MSDLVRIVKRKDVSPPDETAPDRADRQPDACRPAARAGAAGAREELPHGRFRSSLIALAAPSKRAESLD